MFKILSSIYVLIHRESSTYPLTISYIIFYLFLHMNQLKNRPVLTEFIQTIRNFSHPHKNIFLSTCNFSGHTDILQTQSVTFLIHTKIFSYQPVTSPATRNFCKQSCLLLLKENLFISFLCFTVKISFHIADKPRILTALCKQYT